MRPAQNITSFRLRAGLTQVALAERCGMAQPNLAAIEGGRRTPSLESLRRLSEGLGCGIAELLSADETQALDRFEVDRLCRALVANQASKAKVDPALWRDLGAIYHRKLSWMSPTRARKRLRISPFAAHRRLKARLGADVLQQIDRRLDKFYPQEAS